MMFVSFLKGLAVLAAVECTEQKSIERIEVQTQSTEVAALPPRSKMRKLHLVRPDLIPYPIVFEAYC